NFPKHGSDIRTMSSLDVAALLKELDADVTKVVNAGERKSRLKDVIGVGEKGSVVEAMGEAGKMEDGKMVDGVVGGEKEKEKKKAPVQLPGKATAPPPGKVLPIQRRD
ncbi:MAG: hypothetical protein Q9216_007250, partial [Gyalolechia sp. 2 TL-2023]